MTLGARAGAALAAALAPFSLFPAPATAEGARHITVQSGTTLEASGLFEHLLPRFEEMTGIDVRVVAVGTGQALRNARNGNADALLVHHPPSEYAFVANGHGIRRFDLMSSEFYLVGPESDPAAVGGMASAAEALARIAESGAPFVSRADDSGTHHRELALWDRAGIEPDEGGGRWYRETGAGMGTTLNIAVEMGAYTLTERATWLGFGNKGGHAVLVEGDPALFNSYGAIVVDPERHPEAKAHLAQVFVDWLVSAAGQEAIAEFRIGGEQAFFPNAR